jgi:quercetin dioxygenase-like cupin family protein
MSVNVKGFWYGLATGVIVTTGLLPATYAARQGANQPTPGAGTSVVQALTPAYTSKVVLENDRVRVKDVTFPAGVKETGLHTHDLAHVGIILTKGSLVFTEPGGKTETVTFEPGSVGYREANATHQVASGGPGAMRVIEVELK